MSQVDDNTDLIVVVLKHKGTFHWFRSARELWVLDHIKWQQAWLDAGFRLPEPDPSERFGIPIVNESTLDQFLEKMEPFRIESSTLGAELARRIPAAQSWWDVGDLFPSYFVDADLRHACAFYFEGIPVEKYVPTGWTSEFEDFATKYSEERFPKREKFWIQNGIDMLEELNERGRRLNQQ